MFTKISKYCLWDLAPDQVKISDLATEQMLYEGEQRGQTQRFFITCGDVIHEMFQKVESMFSWKSPGDIDADFLDILQRELYANFIVADDVESEALVREILAEIVPAWKLKGTRAFVHWIAWKIFGWQLVDVITLASTVLTTSILSSFLYDDALLPDDQKLLYDPDFMTPDDKVVLIIDVFSDVNFAEKKETLERLLQEWSMITQVSYLNEP